MRNILQQDFFAQPVLEVAPQLLGKYLVRRQCGKESAYRIVEVEAYDGIEDSACHAHRGRTKRTEIMFGSAGVWYIYLVYGMHNMLNVVTDKEEYPASVLIRGVEGVLGPGRLTGELKVTRALNGVRANRASGLWIEDRGKSARKDDVICTPRIGVEYSGEYAQKEYRFLLKA